MNDAEITGWIIIGATALVVLFIVRNAMSEVPAYKEHQKRVRGLVENQVRLAGSEEEIAQMAAMLQADGQDYSSAQLDALSFDDEDTWVMYADGSSSAKEKVEGVLIMRREGDRAIVEAFALDGSVKRDQQTKIAHRLASAAAWEAAQSDLSIQSDLSAKISHHQKLLSPLIKKAITDWQNPSS